MRYNYTIKNAVKYFSRLAVAVDNLQKMHGVVFEVYRIVDRAKNAYVSAFGASKTNLKSTGKLEKVFDVEALATPQDMYTAYCIGSGNSEVEVFIKDNSLVVGDILRYTWVDNQVLEFTIIELPKTFGGCYYNYRIKSTYQIK